MEIHLHFERKTGLRPNVCGGTEPESAIAILKDELQAARNQTAQADVKAGLLGSGVFAGTAVAFASGASTDLSAISTVLAWAAAVGAAFVLTTLGLAVWPRSGKRGGDAALRDPGEVLAEVRGRAADAPGFERALALELAVVRHIAHWKFIWLRVSIIGSGLLILVLGGAIVASAEL